MNARDYKNAAPRAPKVVQRQGSWVSFVSGLGLGLLVALGIYLYAGEMRPPLAVPEPREPVAEADKPVEALPEADATTFEPPRPKFDFYKILPEMEVPVQEWELSEADDKKEAGLESGTYVLQVGSFKQFEDADRAKAKLALQGITANIQRVVINGQDVWFRVHVGPLSDVEDIRAMRMKLIENDTDFILLRIGGTGTT